MSAPEIDRLFQVPLDDFTPTRDALARELRSQGEREASDAVKRTRKPSVSAWAINQVRHHEPERVNELLAAGARLRDAQEALLSGGDRGRLREAAADERALVSDVVQLAIDQLKRVGHPVNASVQTRIHETLHAAAGDDEVRELLAAGRLQREYQLGDLGLAGGGGAAGTPSGRSKTPKPQTDRAAAALRRRLEKANARHRELQEKVKEAETAVRSAQRHLARATAAVEKADAGAARARERLESAAQQVRSLEQELARAQ
jgi:hypothetical protein